MIHCFECVNGLAWTDRCKIKGVGVWGFENLKSVYERPYGGGGHNFHRMYLCADVVRTDNDDDGEQEVVEESWHEGDG